MNILCIALASALSLGSCDSSSSSDKKSAVDTLGTSPVFVNGITDANKGTRRGPVEIKGRADAFMTGTMYLYETTGRNTSRIDSCTIAQGNFTFGRKDYDNGIYMLGTNDNNMCPVIVNPTEAICEVGFKSGKLENSLYAIQSKENEGWAAYLPQETVLLKAIKDAKVAGAKNPSMKAQYEQQTAAKERELVNLQARFIQDYPNTHLAKILTWKQEPYKSDINRYWENIDFTDESIIRSRVLSDRIESFMRTFSKGEEGGFYNCIAIVADKAKASDKMLEYVLLQMLTGFYDSNMENICNYIIDNYINGESCGDADLSNVIKNTASSIQNLSIGRTPPNIVMTDMTGKKFDLYATCAANKYTLVMFWSSWCEHCKGEAPEVKQCYEQWHGKGFETLGVSIDKMKTQWESAVRERGFSFPNVCGMKEYQSAVAKDYRVTKTPTFYLLDSNKQIVLKPKSIREVQNFLASKLK